MVTPQLQKIILTILVTAVVGYFAYNLFAGTPAAPSATLNEPVVGQDILVLVDKLKVFNFDTSIFSSDLITHLTDRSPLILPEAQGRPNPFLPIGQDSIASQ